MMPEKVGVLVPSRVQSPSSIGTYNKCPRKYFYSYIACLPCKQNIAQIRGVIAHSVLDKFFSLDVNGVERQGVAKFFRLAVQDLLANEWRSVQKNIAEVGVSKNDEVFYFEETWRMISNWLEHFIPRFDAETGSVCEVFHRLTPLREMAYLSDEFFVRGIIDVIETHGSETRIMDYKTSNHSNIEEYRLQLAVYSLLFFEKHAKLPDKAGVYFLKENKIKFVDVDDSLLDFAKREIEMIHQRTFSRDKNDYPKNVTGLCKWSSGQCDFYDVCKSDD